MRAVSGATQARQVCRISWIMSGLGLGWGRKARPGLSPTHLRAGTGVGHAELSSCIGSSHESQCWSTPDWAGQPLARLGTGCRPASPGYNIHCQMSRLGVEHSRLGYNTHTHMQDTRLRTNLADELQKLSARPLIPLGAHES